MSLLLGRNIWVVFVLRPLYGNGRLLYKIGDKSRGYVLGTCGNSVGNLLGI